MTDPPLKPDEVKRTLGVSTKTVRRLIACGEFDAFLVDGRLRFDPGSVERYLQAHRARPPADGIRVTHRVTPENQ